MKNRRYTQKGYQLPEQTDFSHTSVLSPQPMFLYLVNFTLMMIMMIMYTAFAVAAGHAHDPFVADTYKLMHTDAFCIETISVCIRYVLPFSFV